MSNKCYGEKVVQKKHYYITIYILSKSTYLQVIGNMPDIVKISSDKAQRTFEDP